MRRMHDQHPQPADVVDMVAYQPGSIVSRTLIKSKNGSVTLFAFDEGERLSEHTAPFDAMVHVIHGRATVSVAGSPHTVATGQLIHLPAHVPHALHAIERFKMMLVMIRAEPSPQ
jgi:quercetin dioxygenase-like cupin family protein